MKEILGHIVTDEYFDYLICENNKGKELKVVDGKVVAVYHKQTQEEINEQRKFDIATRLNKLSQDFIQSLAGAEIEDLEERRLEFQTLHNELRKFEGKPPRKYS